jgi:SPP1 family predicted phage head-tail adaptor
MNAGRLKEVITI